MDCPHLNFLLHICIKIKCAYFNIFILKSWWLYSFIDKLTLFFLWKWSALDKTTFQEESKPSYISEFWPFFKRNSMSQTISFFTPCVTLISHVNLMAKMTVKTIHNLNSSWMSHNNYWNLIVSDSCKSIMSICFWFAVRSNETNIPWLKNQFIYVHLHVYWLIIIQTLPYSA